MTDHLSSPYKPSSEETDLPAHSERAVASVVLGLLGLFLVVSPLEWWGGAAILVEIICFLTLIIGLVQGCRALKTLRRGMAILGMVLNILGLVIFIVNFAIGFYLGYHGLL